MTSQRRRTRFWIAAVLLSALFLLVGGTAAYASTAPIADDDGALQTEVARLIAADGAADDYLGISVDIDGDTMVVGAFLDDVGPNADAGSAYVFTRSGTIWSFQQKLVAPDGAANDYFGQSVAVSGDTIIVGTPKQYVDYAGQGSAYVFTRSGAAWAPQKKLVAPDGAAGDYFGMSVAVDGDRAMVGAYGDDTAPDADRGAAYVFTRTGTEWSSGSKIYAPDGAAGDAFGMSVAISGETAVVGAFRDDVDGKSDQGSAHVFTLSITGLWKQQAQLSSFDGAAGDMFGISVAFSDDTALVGAFHDASDGNTNQGSAYAFTRTGDAWTLQQKMVAPDGATDDLFGMAVDISGDTAVIGACKEVGGGPGSAYFFTRSGTAWTYQTELYARDGVPGDDFARDVAIDGEAIVVPAPNLASNGVVYVYDRYKTAEDTAVYYPAPGILANDADADGDPLVAELFSPAGGGIVVVSPNGGFIYTPYKDYHGTDAFLYRAFDGTDYSYPALVWIEVASVNDAPVANPDGPYAAEKDMPLSVSSTAGVLVNDTDVDDPTLSASLLSDPAHGTVMLNQDGAFTYAPAPGYTGIDTFTYAASDGALESDAAVVTIFVLAPNEDFVPAGTDVTASVGDVSAEFDSVTAAGVLSSTPTSLGPDQGLPSGFKVAGTVYQVTTTATYSGKVHVTLPYNDSGMTLEEEQNLKLFHWDASADGGAGDWVDITIPPVDTVNDLVTGECDTLSPFVVVGPAGTLQGTVVDANTLAPIQAATILLDTGESVFTDPSGGYSFAPLAEGLYDVTCSAAGYLPQTAAAVTVMSGAVTVQDFALLPEPVNQPPVANDDMAVTAEDTDVVIDLIANDIDPEGDTLWIDPASVTEPAHGSLSFVDPGHVKYTPDMDWFGTDSFMYRATDLVNDSNAATVNIAVMSVDDPPTISVDPTEQTVQYSDLSEEIHVKAHDLDGPTLTVTDTGLPADIINTIKLTSYNPDGSIDIDSYYQGRLNVPKGEYPATFTASDGELLTSVGHTVKVEPEDAAVVFDPLNPVAVKVATAGGASGDILLKLNVNEIESDPAMLGDITKAVVYTKLVPLGLGPSVLPVSIVGPDPTGAVTLKFTGVPVSSYSLLVAVGGGYYSGYGEDALTVYDPTSGFATGGGTFFWPGTQDRTTFGFETNYGKKKTAFKGNLVLIRHMADGTYYRMKSTSLTSLAVGKTTDAQGPYGWASFSGKATYIEPGWPASSNEYSFTAYAEDRNEPGVGVDRFWIKVVKGSSPAPMLTMPPTPYVKAVPLTGGNIAIPHNAK